MQCQLLAGSHVGNTGAGEPPGIPVPTSLIPKELKTKRRESRSPIQMIAVNTPSLLPWRKCRIVGNVDTGMQVKGVSWLRASYCSLEGAGSLTSFCVPDLGGSPKCKTRLAMGPKELKLMVRRKKISEKYHSDIHLHFSSPTLNFGSKDLQ